VQAKSYSVTALGLAAGLPEQGAVLAGLAAGAALLGLTVVVARRRSAMADERAVTLALAAALVLTPILWLHYFVLLFLPLALFRRSFSPAWLIPLAFWVTPFQESGGEVWRIVLALGLAAAALAAGASRPSAAAVAASTFRRQAT
jgi:hypothetical protein